MKVQVRHLTRLDYSATIVEGVMEARLGPLSDAHQRWERYDLEVHPFGSTRRYTDGFGNAAHLLTVPGPHQFVEVIAQGDVQTLLVDPFAPLPVAPPPLSQSDRVDYLSPSAFVALLPELEAMAAPFRADNPAERFEAARGLTKLVHESFSYVQNVTSVTTTVPEVLASRNGVCQDFAHVLIGLCRAIEIPARYVSGYIVASDETAHASSRPGGQSQSASQSRGAADRVAPSRGGGASHAWVEAYTTSHGWRGFDPTNNLVASEHHIKVAIGRDYGDVPPTRGTFRGDAEERLLVEVTTRHLD